MFLKKQVCAALKDTVEFSRRFVLFMELSIYWFGHCPQLWDLHTLVRTHLVSAAELRLAERWASLSSNVAGGWGADQPPGKFWEGLRLQVRVRGLVVGPAFAWEPDSYNGSRHTVSRGQRRAGSPCVSFLGPRSTFPRVAPPPSPAFFWGWDWQGLGHTPLFEPITGKGNANATAGLGGLLEGPWPCLQASHSTCPQLG